MLKELYTLIKMLFATRPSQFLGKDLEVQTMKHFPFAGYKAMAWCGKIIHRAGSSEVNAKKLYKQLGGTPTAWKEYVKSL